MRTPLQSRNPNITSGPGPFQGTPEEIKNYENTLRKIGLFAEKNNITLSKQRIFFEQGNSKDYALLFRDAFYNPRMPQHIGALKNYIETRQQLLGDRLRGTGIPCILFTSIEINEKEYCLVAISGIEHIEKISGNKVRENIRIFWNTMNAFFAALSATTHLPFVFLGGRSKNYDRLLDGAHAILRTEKPADHNTHKSCAEKATFNLIQKLETKYGTKMRQKGLQAMAFHPLDLTDVGPCKDCAVNAPLVREVNRIAKELSPKHNPSTPRNAINTVSISPFKTTPPREPNVGDSRIGDFWPAPIKKTKKETLSSSDYIQQPVF